MNSEETLPPQHKILRLPPNMDAVVYAQYGSPDVLSVTQVKSPTPTPDQVTIRVHSAGVNPIDYRLRKGQAKWLLPGHFPRIPGYDVAGEVVFAPADSGMKPGDRVMAFLDSRYGGGYAEYACCHPTSVAPIPPGMSFDDAAALPLAGSTALQSLRDHGKLQSGDSVLINGASGGVGAFAVQIAKAYGATVTGVASGENEAFVRSLGADEFMDYTETDFTKLDRTWNLVFDAAGKSDYFSSHSVLADNGHYVSTEPDFSGAMISVLTKFLSKQGTIMLANPDADDLHELIRLYEQGQLKVVLDDVIEMSEATAAHQKIQNGVDRGKLVLRVK
ncbi:NAD(P)-dependent alcohol dehydrogenase [Stieleria tagensis]|uniref:NAD(P)-dependent alcohol dehydrogenase n=1 Tax=Stieleria tagensis TaxID=2956795 RepID=UPI00209B0417|nr:NAD(P)-dependent alcohol dehydrogenase [Stieleria tagensis]